MTPDDHVTPAEYGELADLIDDRLTEIESGAEPNVAKAARCDQLTAKIDAELDKEDRDRRFWEALLRPDPARRPDAEDPS
jgi:hypothetical protein